MSIPRGDRTVNEMWRDALGISLGAAILLVLAPSAQASTWYVANNGVDGPGCGAKASPCRSISAAIAQPTTVAGDKIIVGPGRYGDLDRDGIPGEVGEETPAPGCGCMLAVNKSLSVVSSDGAASTVIDARSLDVNASVAIFMVGGEFGRPGKGFTVTSTAAALGRGIVLDSEDVAVRGNQVVWTGSPGGAGIELPFPQDILVEANQVIGWPVGIRAQGTGNLVRKNRLSLNGVAIAALGGTITGNIAAGNNAGVSIKGSPVVVGNSFYGNWVAGVALSSTFGGRIEMNNVVGNALCGLENGVNDFNDPGVPGLVAPNNYWGAPTGPGPDPADAVCDSYGGSTTASPFATKPFKVKAPIKP